jgi:hypothetical protein
MDRMLAAAQHLMRGMPRHQLAGLSPSSSIMQSLTSASFSIAMAPDMQQRAMRMAHEKAALASQAAAVEDQARTGGVVAFGYQRPGNRARDDDARSGSGRSSLGGLGGVGMGFDANSVRFAGLGNERVTPAVARVMQMASHEAVRTGIPWAVSKPDLLKQGPAGVKAVADVQIKEPTYQRLTTQAHFVAKEVVTLATFAKVKGVADANPLAHATTDVVQIGATTPKQVAIKNVIVGYMAASTAAAAKPNDPAAQAQLEANGMAMRATLTPIAASSPENYTRVQSFEDEAKVEKQFRATVAKNEMKAELLAGKANQAVTAATTVQSTATAAQATATQLQVTAAQTQANSVTANLKAAEALTAENKATSSADAAFGFTPPAPMAPDSLQPGVRAGAMSPTAPGQPAPTQTAGGPAPAAAPQQVAAKPDAPSPAPSVPAATQTAQAATPAAPTQSTQAPTASQTVAANLDQPASATTAAPVDKTVAPTQTAAATPAAPSEKAAAPTQTAAAAPAKAAPAMKPA